jgi:transcriptional regulator with XRE-family HTH domain
MSVIQKKLAEKIRVLRKQQGLSQQELAVNINMDLTSVNEIENGRRNPSLKTIEKIARALKVPVFELFKF